MKYIILFLLIFFTSAQNIDLLTIEGDVNTEKYPELKINFNYYYPEKLLANDVKIIENNKEKTIDKLISKPRFSVNTPLNVLVLFENVASRPQQNLFYKNILTDVLLSLDDNIKINVATFDRIRTDTKRLKFLFPKFVQDRKKLVEKIKKITPIYDKHGLQKSTELFLAINDALEYLNKNYKHQNNIIIIFSAGYNLRHTNSPTLEDLIEKSLKYRVPLYVLQYFLYEHRSLKKLAEDSYGLFAFTKNEKKAKASLIKFISEAPKRLLGYDYTAIYKSSYSADGKNHIIVMNVLNDTKELTFNAPCNFICKIKNNIIIIVIGVLILISILFIITKVVKRDSQENPANEKQSGQIPQAERTKTHKPAIASEDLNKTQVISPQKPKTDITKIKKAYNGIIPSVVIYKDKKPVLEVPLNNYSFIIGRDSSADILLDDTKISRKHAEIFFQNDAFYIKDLKSTNGTFINGQKIIPNYPYKMNDRDTISLANTYIIHFKT